MEVQFRAERVFFSQLKELTGRVHRFDVSVDKTRGKLKLAARRPLSVPDGAWVMMSSSSAANRGTVAAAGGFTC